MSPPFASCDARPHGPRADPGPPPRPGGDPRHHRRVGAVAIPVSAIWRRDARCLLALSRRRATVERLRDDPRAALSLNGRGFSLCVAGEARVAADPLPGAESMIAFVVEAHRVWDARGPATDIDAGIRRRWTAPEDERRHALVLEALADLGRRTPGPDAGAG